VVGCCAACLDIVLFPSAFPCQGKPVVRCDLTIRRE
jgi:hypothetical protein